MHQISTPIESEGSAKKNIRFVFFLNVAFTLLEFIGGYLINSVAIMSDAIHDLGDSISLGTAWYLEKKAEKPANPKYPYGYKRFSLLGAFINGVVLVLGSICIIYEAVARIIEPEPIHATGMVAFGVLGIVVNGWAVLKLKTGKTLNEKVLSWHLLEDVLGWVAILLVGIVLHFYNLPVLDAILSILITTFILFNTLKRTVEAVHLFLQGTPHNLHINKLKEEIENVSGVSNVLHLNAWSLDGESHVIEVEIHADFSNQEEYAQVFNDSKKCLSDHGKAFVSIIPKEK